MSRTTRVLAASGLVLAPLFWAPPAYADEDRLGLSLDGVTFTDSIEGPLFDQDVRWVPGDVRVATFYVRNESSDAGDLSVRVTRDGEDGELLTSGAVHLEAKTAGQAWQTIRAGSELGVMSVDDIRSGAVVPVEIRARMLATAPNSTMRIAADLGLAVRLNDATAVLGAGDVPEGGSDGDGTVVLPGSTGGSGSGNGGSNESGADADVDGLGAGFLPETGYGLPPGLAWLGLALCGSGAFLITRRRNGRTEVRHG